MTGLIYNGILVEMSTWFPNIILQKRNQDSLENWLIPGPGQVNTWST